MRVGEMWEKNGRRWGVTASSPTWADLEDGTCRTGVRLDEAEANGWKRINGRALHYVVWQADYIRVWPWHQAPLALRDLSTNGGDEDWIAVVPSITSRGGVIGDHRREAGCLPIGVGEDGRAVELVIIHQVDERQ